MPSVTLLAPARDIQVARAAVQAGADAVYIGPPRFGARQAAGNSLDDLRALADYARPFRVRVLVTLNTLMSADERREAADMAWQLYEAGVSALIIQDLRLLRENLPPIRLHASTQCDNRTPEQVLRLWRMGFSRVVLARELSIGQIRDIHEAVMRDCKPGEQPVELEAFVHGALCVSYSGRCFMSEVLMNRSANRGCCAQMCRQRYDLLDASGRELTDDDGRPIHQRYLLSLQDMDRSLYLRDMLDAGVTTFKIEGRLKDADYVTNVVAFYRERLDSILGAHHDVFTRSFTPDPQKTFHRGGTDYFLNGRTAQMAEWKTPKSTGEFVGTVVSRGRGTLTLSLEKGVVLQAGDGLCYADKGFAVNRADGAVVTPNRMPDAEPGTRIFRNLNTAFLRSMSVSRRVPVDILFEETDGGFRISMGAVSMEFPADKQPARNRERALDTVREQLSKLGDTPFVARTVTVSSSPCFLPASLLNRWRRTLVDALLQQPAPRPSSAPSRAPLGADAALEPEPRPERNLMTCRYCILHEMNHCRKLNPLRNEPRFLRLQNGTLLALAFDCARCEMTVSEP
jgi:putative protease